MAYKEVKDIEVGNIQVVGREGARYKIQCLKADVANLPLNGIASGSTALILDAKGVEDKVLVFNKTKEETNGNWYSIDSGEPVEITAGKLVYNRTSRCVEQLGGN